MKLTKHIVVTLIFTLLFIGCKSYKEELIIGISPWPGYEPLVLAMEQGFYAEAGVKIVRYPTPTESFRALRDGVVDVAAFTVDEALHYAEVYDKPKIILILDVSNGGDALVVRPDIKTLDALKGKRIGVEPSALGDYLLSRSMDFTQGIQRKDIKIVPIEVGMHLQAYKERKVDALMTYNPSKNQLIDAGAHVLFDSSQIPYEVVDVLVTNNKVMKEKKDQLIVLKKGWFQALSYIQAHRKEAMEKMGRYEHMDANEFDAAFSELLIPSMEENIEMLNDKNSHLYKAVNKLSKLMFDKGTLSSQVKTDALFDPTILMAH